MIVPEKISGKYHESKKFLKVHAHFNVDCSINHKSKKSSGGKFEEKTAYFERTMGETVWK